MVPVVISATPYTSNPVGGILFENIAVYSKEPHLRPFEWQDASSGSVIQNIQGDIRVVTQEGETTIFNIDQDLLESWYPNIALLADLTPWSGDLTGIPFGDRSCETKDIRFRGDTDFLIRVEEPGEVQLNLINRPVGKYEDLPPIVTLAGLDENEIELGRTTAISFRVDSPGIYRCRCSGTQSTVSIVQSSNPWGVDNSTRPLHLFHATGRFAFFIPQGTKLCALRASGAGEGERVSIAVYDPDECLIDERNDLYATDLIRLEDPILGIWSVELKKPEIGVLEDVYIQVLGLPPVIWIE